MPRTLLLLLGSSHPLPTAAVTAIAVLLGAALGLEPWRLAALGAAVLAGQLAIGLANDWLDAEEDRAAGRRDKPAARGDVPVRTVRAAALATAAASLLLAAPLGGGAWLANAVLLGAGLAYDAGLKRTPLSHAAYLAGFGALPAIAALSIQPPALPAWWAVAASALLGGAAHFANVLPDLEADAAAGVRGLPQRLGRRATTALTGAQLAAAAAVIVLGAGASPLLIAGLALVLASGVAVPILAARAPASRAPFAFVVLAALAATAMLLASGGRILA
ncbi:UbiA family prenyltransferase [Homoserinibacter sp. YIM 151385]|uniref:UbiA family prenyltransferase n=1 Tax=Homoserinibacter sp. YIM 151385 TaxID=2985506 RepID=UPI0022F0D0EF|nr:UbiA family prenyltransferase [Homoserinibacter sp. YIM 151385]WBU38962.1 UbiA family prenyltransferase [Homoserinibacter sp. YIM 151385]